MTRFDVHESSSSPLKALGKAVVVTLLGHSGMVLSALWITFVVLLVATFLISLTTAMPTALRSAYAASSILIFAAPNAQRSEVEALGARLKALPIVADAALRSKETALAELVEAGLPAATDSHNPLPDVWTIHLRVDDSQGGDPNFTTMAVGARDAIAALPGVDRVKYDDGWVAFLDRCARRWSAYGNPAIAGFVLVLAICILGLYGLFTRAIASSRTPATRAAKSVLAVVEACIVIVSAVLVELVVSSIVHSSIVSTTPSLKLIGDQVGPNATIIIAAASLAAMLLAMIANAIGAVRE